jgi:hypothetical protein
VWVRWLCAVFWWSSTVAVGGFDRGAGGCRGRVTAMTGARPGMEGLSYPRRLLREVYRVMRAYGALYTGVDPATAAEWAAEDARVSGVSSRSVRGLTGPAAAHPERVLHDVPLTALERALQREWGSG